MIDYQLFRILQNFNQKKWGDDELEEDLEFLIKVLDEELAVLGYSIQQIIFNLTIETK